MRQLVTTILIFLLTQPISAIQYDPSNKINQLALTMALLKQNYISQMDDNLIAEKAIRGLLNQLDPHSDYLDINDFSSLNDITNAQVTGIGIEITIDQGVLKVVAPLDDSPAQKAGIKNGDLITHVNDSLVLDIGFSEAISQIKGKVGTDVKITVVRPGMKKPLIFRIVREIINAPTVRSEMINPEIGYLRISYFGLPSADSVKSQVTQLIKENPEIQGIIIDLRNNPGGVLESAIDISDLFLDKRTIGHDGIIATAKERNQNITQIFKSTSGDITNGMPLVVVVNSGSASGSEIMAGALKDHKRATVVGERTFGKGSIQTVMPLSETSAIKITTGLYYTPSGNVVQKQGIQPDVLSPKLMPVEPDLLMNIRETDYKKSIQTQSTTSKSLSSEQDKLVVQKYGFEVYQSIQVILSQQRALPCT